MTNVPAKTDAVTCFLNGHAYRTRVARIHALMERALIAHERSATAVCMRFRRDAGVAAHLEELVALEQECCPFLVFELEKLPGDMVLAISGPESASALLDDVVGGAAACQAVKAPTLRRHTAWHVLAMPTSMIYKASSLNRLKEYHPFCFSPGILLLL